MPDARNPQGRCRIPCQAYGNRAQPEYPPARADRRIRARPAQPLVSPPTIRHNGTLDDTRVEDAPILIPAVFTILGPIETEGSEQMEDSGMITLGTMLLCILKTIL